MPPPPLRIAIWLAVSTEAQAADDKDSLSSQMADATSWANQNGYEVTRTFEIPGHTRSYTRFSHAAAEIPAYRQLEQACQEKSFDVLWCRERSRLGRTRALIATVEAIVAESGAEVYSAKMPHRVGSASQSARGLLGAIEGWQAEDEITQLVYRHKMGMAGRLRRGLPGGSWPMGYEATKNDAGKTVGGRFTQYADAVRYMTQLFLNGIGYATIARMMNESPYRPPAGKRWYSGVVHKTMHNDTYGGVVHYSGQRQESDRYPHLWDAETFEAIRRERLRRSQKTGGKPYKSAVSGVAVCARCGGRLVVNSVRGNRYFRCPTHARKFVTGAETCHPNHIAEHRIIAVLDAWLAEIRTEERDDVLALLDSGETNRADVEAEQQNAKNHIESIRIQQDRLADYAAAGALSLDAVGRKNEELSEQLGKWQSQLDGLAEVLTLMPDPVQRLEALGDLLNARSLADLPPAAVRLALQRAGVRVVVEEGRVVRIE